MNQQKKHYLKVGGILGVICLFAASVIVATNLLTKDAISKNTIASEQKAMKSVLPNAYSFGEKQEIKEVEYLKSYTVGLNENKEEIGYVYYTSGKNVYGSISMMVAIYLDSTIGRISLVENTESYASTIEEEYVAKYNKNLITIYDTKCGATKGATLIKNMALQAQKHYQERILAK